MLSHFLRASSKGLTKTTFLSSQFRSTSNINSSAPITYSAVPLGAASANRIFVINVFRYNFPANTIVPTITINGVGATFIPAASAEIGVTGTTMAMSFWAYVPNGTVGDIVYNAGGAVIQDIGIYILGFDSISPTSPLSSFLYYEVNGSTSTSLTVSYGFIPSANSAVAVFASSQNRDNIIFSGNLTTIGSTDIRSNDYAASAYAQNLSNVSTTFSASGVRTGDSNPALRLSVVSLL
jgi:hypothetical protein